MRPISKILSLFNRNRSLTGLLIVASIFLLTGTLHDYPYILHPDESTTVKTALAQRFTFGVDRFDWGHFGFYFQYFLFEILIKARVVFNLLGIEDLLRNNFNLIYQDPYIFYAISRMSTQVMSVVTVFLVYKICRLFFEKGVSIIATSFLVAAPYFLYLSHYAVQDPPQLFFLTLSLFVFLRKSFSKSIFGLILSSIFLACSAAYKINIVIFVPFFYLANFLIEEKENFVKNFFTFGNVKRIIIWTLVFLVTFFGVHYTIFTDWNTFWSYEPSYGFLWQIQVNSSPRADYNLQTIVPEFLSHISKTFSISSGLMVIFAIGYSIVSLANKIYRKKYSSKDLILLILIISEIIFTVIMMKSGKYRVHYLFPIYPLLILSVAYLISNFKFLSKYLYLLVLIYPLYLVIIQTIEMNRLSTTSIVVSEMLNDSSRTYYYKSDDIHNVKLWNYISDIHNITGNEHEVKIGDIFVTDMILDSKEYKLSKTQDNYLRMGTSYYFYEKVE